MIRDVLIVAGIVGLALGLWLGWATSALIAAAGGAP